MLTQKCRVFIKATRSSSACLTVNLSVINQPADFNVQMDGIHRSLAKSGLPGSLILLKLEKHIVYPILYLFKLKTLDVPYLMKMIPRCTLLYFRGKKIVGMRSTHPNIKFPQIQPNPELKLKQPIWTYWRYA